MVVHADWMLTSHDMSRDGERTNMRISRRGDYNTRSIEYFLVEGDDRGMPKNDASEKLIQSHMNQLAICRQSAFQRPAWTSL